MLGRVMLSQRMARRVQVSAVWLADAALQLQHPEAPMYAHLNKLLGKRPALDLQASFSRPVLFPNALSHDVVLASDPR